jgi:hypothetical protein
MVAAVLARPNTRCPDFTALPSPEAERVSPSLERDRLMLSLRSARLQRVNDSINAGYGSTVSGALPPLRLPANQGDCSGTQCHGISSSMDDCGQPLTRRVSKSSK